jgi:hypothetical protein
MFGFTNYLFVDEDDNIIEEVEFRDDEPAENHGLWLMKKHGKIIGVYREISILDPINEEAAQQNVQRTAGLVPAENLD